MSEWHDPSKKLPADGEAVDVRLAEGRIVRKVEFSGGRFWRIRQGNGGQAYNVAAWREIGRPKTEAPKTEAPKTDETNL